MPPELQGAGFIGGYFGNTLDLHRFVDDGAGFKTERIVSPIISSSKAFRPVDVSDPGYLTDLNPVPDGELPDVELPDVELPDVELPDGELDS